GRRRPGRGRRPGRPGASRAARPVRPRPAPVEGHPMTEQIPEPDHTATPAEARARFRAGLVTPTAGWCDGYTQANLIAVPKDLAWDFLLFAQRNPQPCPVLDVLEAGSLSGPLLDGDIRTDIPRYRVYVDGELTEEPTDVVGWWRDDLVGFLIGCSFTFERALGAAGVPIRHVEQGVNVPMYRTSVRCRPAGAISGPMVVSMRPVPADLVETAVRVPRASVRGRPAAAFSGPSGWSRRPVPAGLVETGVRVTAAYPAVHGAPVHVGDPRELGIRDLDSPDYGDPVRFEPGDVPVFW